MTPQEKLAASLAKLEELQRSGRRVFRSRELGRVHRERLVQQGFLREIMRGWLLATSPDADPGDTTPWYASFWEFCAAYCNERFGDRWHLSPEQSLLLLAENTVIPDQLVVHAPQGTNNNVELLFGSSLYDLKRPALPPEGDLVRRRELLLYGTVPALLKVPPPFFRRHPIEAEVVLTGLDRPSELISRLLDGGHTVIAGRLAGALRRVGRRDIAQEIIDAMRSAGYDVREADPFADAGTVTPLQTPAAPIAGRLQALWHSSRGPILRAFSDTPKPRLDAKTYLRRVDEVYESDAYHSLSIEGYVVTPELIERVRAGDWQPDERDADRKSRDALAARGYWEAFQLVKESVRQILAGESAAELIREAHRHWYRALFQPSVRVGLIPASALAGYRNDAVFIRGSRHVPPRREAVPEAMSALFDLLEGESEPAVRAVLAHWLIGYIHPYPDGNGRMARFAMNAMLASGGYPWTVIRVEDRDDYLQALERASVDNDITPFATFIAACVRSFEHAVGSL